MSDRQAAILAAEQAIAAVSPAVKAEPVVEPAPIAPEAEKPEVIAPHAEVPADDGEDENDSEESATSGDGDEATAQPKRKDRRQERFDKLTREKHEERRAREQAVAEANYWREQAQRSQPPPQNVQAPPQGKPTLEAYGNDWNAYEEARDAWVLNQARETFTQERQKWEREQQQATRQARFAERVAAFEREVPGGWQQAVNAPVETTPVMLDAIADSEIGPKIGYYLAQNLDEALTISRLPPLQQAVAMGRIEAKLLSVPPQPPRPTVTRAPAPPPPIPSGASTGASARLSGIEDHIAVVKAQKLKRYTG